MHLFETAAQRRWADHLYPEGLLTVLDEMGLLSPRAVFAHGVHLTAPELELLAERGCSVVANVSSNFRLSSGVTPLEEWDRSRVPVAIGLDGMALDDDLDMWRELRLVRGLWQAQRRCGVAAEDVLAAATAGGIAGLGSAAPEPLRVGSRADFVVHDLPRWSAVAREAAWSAAELVLAGASRRSVAETWCGGVQVYRSAQSA